MPKADRPKGRSAFCLCHTGIFSKLGAGGETRTLMRSEPRQILSLVRIPISPLRLVIVAAAILIDPARCGQTAPCFRAADLRLAQILSISRPISHRKRMFANSLAPLYNAPAG